MSTKATSLTAKQKRVWLYMCEHYLAYGEYPTVRQIASKIGVSSYSTAHRHLEHLAKQGYVKLAGAKNPTRRARVTIWPNLLEE